MPDFDDDESPDDAEATYLETDLLAQDIRERYAELVADAGRPGTNRKAVIGQIAVEMAAEDRKATADMWRALVDKSIESVDTKIRSRLHAGIDYVVALLTDPDGTILGAEDPTLRTPIPGLEPGERVALRYATVPVLLRLVTDRTAHAKAAADAADRMAKVMTRLVGELGERGVASLDELVEEPA